MYKEIVGNSLNHLTFLACQQLINSGNRIESRNGQTQELCDVGLFLKNPQGRHLYLEGRKSNLYATIGETLWVMAGRSELNPLMNFLLPRAKDFSDNGETWRGAYGPRLYEHDQIQNVLDIFKTDGPNTRRAVMAIWNPDRDTNRSLMERYELSSTKDLPCNNFIWFWIRDNKLNMRVGVRSNDVIWGLSSINVFEFTFLQECILQLLKNSDDRFKDLQLGYYHQSVISLHVYDFTLNQAKSILENNKINEDRFPNKGAFPILLGSKIQRSNELRDFFTLLYNNFCKQIEKEPYTTVENIFKLYNVPTEHNQLYDYMTLVGCYIDSKTSPLNNMRPILPYLSADLAAAVICNSFTPKSWKL